MRMIVLPSNCDWGLLPYTQIYFTKCYDDIKWYSLQVKYRKRKNAMKIFLQDDIRDYKMTILTYQTAIV